VLCLLQLVSLVFFLAFEDPPEDDLGTLPTTADAAGSCENAVWIDRMSWPRRAFLQMRTTRSRRPTDAGLPAALVLGEGR